MEKDIIEALESLGLSDKEIKVYVALLELGDSPVQKITERSELNRVTVYPVLKSLIEKGFVSKFFMERKSYFKSIEPNHILDMIKEKEEKIKLAMPFLQEKLKNIKTTTSIELFRGAKGVSSFFEKLYSGKDKELWAYGNGELIGKVLEYQSLHARKLRLDKKIKLNLIASPVKEDYLKDPRYKKMTNIKFNEKLKDIHVYIIFGKERAGILELTKELNAILINNEEIAKYHKFVFDMLQ